MSEQKGLLLLVRERWKAHRRRFCHILFHLLCKRSNINQSFGINLVVGWLIWLETISDFLFSLMMVLMGRCFAATRAVPVPFWPMPGLAMFFFVVLVFLFFGVVLKWIRDWERRPTARCHKTHVVDRHFNHQRLDIIFVRNLLENVDLVWNFYLLNHFIRDLLDDGVFLDVMMVDCVDVLRFLVMNVAAKKFWFKFSVSNSWRTYCGASDSWWTSFSWCPWCSPPKSVWKFSEWSSPPPKCSPAPSEWP